MCVLGCKKFCDVSFIGAVIVGVPCVYWGSVLHEVPGRGFSLWIEMVVWIVIFYDMSFVVWGGMGCVV